MQNSSTSEMDDEISINDIIAFLYEHLFIILGFGLAGVLAATCFVLLTPARYEALAQIQVAQISSGSKGDRSSVSATVAMNVEDPNLLLARLKIPSTFPDAVITACDLHGQPLAAESIVNLTKASPLKNVASVIEIRVQRGSPQLAKQCSQSIFEMIKQQHEKIISVSTEQMKQELSEFENKLESNRKILEKLENSGTINPVFLSIRDEKFFLLQRIDNLKSDITFNTSHKSQLVTPIYASDKAVFPKVFISLLIGAFGGLMFGLFFAMGRKKFVYLRMQKML